MNEMNNAIKFRTNRNKSLMVLCYYNFVLFSYRVTLYQSIYNLLYYYHCYSYYYLLSFTFIKHALEMYCITLHCIALHCFYRILLLEPLIVVLTDCCLNTSRIAEFWYLWSIGGAYGFFYFSFWFSSLSVLSLIYRHIDVLSILTWMNWK